MLIYVADGKSLKKHKNPFLESKKMETDLNLWQSLTLAAIQGVTEFLPVSSSGHLVLARKIFGWADQGGLVFDTVLHGGSLAAILIYFWREWIAVFHAYFWSKKGRTAQPCATGMTAGQAVPPYPETVAVSGGLIKYYRRLPWLIVAATVPVVITGPVLKPLLESDATVRNASITGLSMIMTALVFLLAEQRKSETENPVSFLNALFIGCLQIIALLPGASRSGWTTAGGIFSGQNRENAVRFAFLMAVPAIAGAIIFQSREIIRSPEAGFDPFFILSGFGVSLLVSLGAIHFCLKYFRSHSLRPFAIYLLIIGLLSLLIK